MNSHPAPRPVVLPLVFVLGLMFLLGPTLTPAAHAADPIILRVTTTGESNLADTSCGSDWITPCGLQHALNDRANTGSGGTSYELWVASGIYTPTATEDRSATFQLKNSVALYGGFSADGGEFEDRDVTANDTILSGDLLANDNSNVAYNEPTRGENAYHVVTGSGTNSTAVLDGFTVKDGNANATSETDSNCCGGGMYSYQGAPTVRNVAFTANSTHFYGGGMYNDSGSPVLTNVTFSSNNAASVGGGMMNWYSSKPTLTNVTFSGNSASEGGGMKNYQSNPTLTNVTFTANSASDGAGMFNSYNSSPTLTNVTFTANEAGVNGGGMENYNAGNPALTNVTFSGNSATEAGGGMYNLWASNPTITNTIFWGNTATPGTGPQIYNDPSDYPCTARIRSSVVHGGCPDAGSTCTDIIDADPLLGSLDDWGGSTRTIRLLLGSSAIDRGDGAACPVTDQRGRPRLGACDIGAFEFQGYTMAKKGGDHQTTLVNLPFATSLQVRLTEVDTSLPATNLPITFTAPSAGPSAAWSGSTTITRTTWTGGVAEAPAPMANETPGSYLVTASPPGASSPVTFSFTNQANTTSTVTSLANPSVVGQAITFTATVSGAAATGTITFKDEGADIYGCIARPLTGSSATCTLTSLSVGTHTITVAYSGNGNILPSTSSPLSQVVNKANTATTLTSSPNPSTAGGSVVFTATVSVMPPGSGTPTGTVEFCETSSPTTPARAARNALAAQPLVDGSASFSVSSLAAGTHSMLVVYSGDGQNQASTSSVYGHVVGPAALFKLLLPVVVR